MAVVPILMEEVKRTNIVVIRNLGQEQEIGQPRKDPNIIDMDRRDNRNCYNYRGFRHMARNCRNRRMGMNRRMETEDNNNLNGNGSLIGLN